MEAVDPRCHFAKLRGYSVQVFNAENIEQALDTVTRHFIQYDLVYDAENKQIKISQLFKWYNSDFGSDKNLLHFVVKYLADEHALKKEWTSTSQLTDITITYHDKQPWDPNGRGYEREPSSIEKLL